MALLIAVLLYDETTLSKFFENEKKITEILMTGLFYFNKTSTHIQIRRMFANAIYVLVRQSRTSLKHWMTQLLLENMPQIGNQATKESM